MEMNIYSIYDRVTGNFSQPLLCSDSENHIIGIRLFKSIITPDSLLYKCPADYSFYFIGTFDDKDGTFTMDKEYICSADDIKMVDGEDTENLISHIIKSEVK